MPTSCQHFRLLQTRLDELSRKFVDDQARAESADPAGFSPDLDRLAAYRLLVHAELEEFLEAKAKDRIGVLSGLATRATAWMRGAPELLALATALSVKLPTPAELESNGFLSFVQALVTQARAVIAGNNGVKTQSFVLLSICSGKTADEIDNVLAASLNSYGKDRGDVAHQSVTRSRTLQAPSAELATARALAAQIATYFDVCL